MMRPLTLLAMLLAAGSGAYLFAVKHRAQVLDDQLAAIAQASRLDAQRIRVLQAQWALEIDPTRVGQLAARFTTLQPMRPAQLVTLASLQAALPPPGSFMPGNNPANGAVPDFAPQPAIVAGQTLPLPPALPPGLPAPVMVASARPARAPHPAAARGPASWAASRHHAAPATQLAAASPARPFYQNAVPAAPMGAQVVSVKAETMPALQGGDTGPAPGSALGMAADLAPPRPLLGGNGN